MAPGEAQRLMRLQPLSGPCTGVDFSDHASAHDERRGRPARDDLASEAKVVSTHTQNTQYRLIGERACSWYAVRP